LRQPITSAASITVMVLSLLVAFQQGTTQATPDREKLLSEPGAYGPSSASFTIRAASTTLTSSPISKRRSWTIFTTSWSDLVEVAFPSGLC
jgi:hypothetical protein